MFGLDIKTTVIAVVIFAVGSTIFANYRYVTNLSNENKQLQSQVDQYKLANQTLVAERETLKANLATSKAEQEKLNTNLAGAREQMNRMTRLFADHDFTTLAKKKPGLITNRIRAGTKKLFDEIENESHK